MRLTRITGFSLLGWFSCSVIAGASPGGFRHADGLGILGEQRQGLSELLRLAGDRLELAEQSSQPQWTLQERAEFDQRFASLGDQMDWIASVTNYEGLTLLDLEGTASVQVAPGSSQLVEIHIVDATTAYLGTDALDVTTAANAQAAVWSIRAGLETLSWFEQRNCAEHSLLGVELGCAQISAYCQSSVNSSGAAATIFAAGSLSLALEGELLVYTKDCPAGRFGWFVVGQGRARLPFGDGSLCLDSSVAPLQRLGPGQLVPSIGQVIQSLDSQSYAAYPSLQAGEDRFVQFFFRDSGPAGVNSTDGVRLTFGL